jgi:glycosyltransferase involved in cell wall biosynthesis
MEIQMNRKLRVLWIGESSFLKSGYGVYTNEVLQRLHASGKYELAEFGIYGDIRDARQIDIPWLYYANNPDIPEQEAVYKANPRNQFGHWKFEELCLDFKPDVVCTIRDPWMDEFVERSPFRPYYKWAMMPTIDSLGQPKEWLAMYRNCDAAFAYTEFGRDYLFETCGENLNFIDVASPAVDYDIFCPVEDKNEFRQRFGLDDGLTIIGTVMRNQRRKLYPDLIKSFAQLCRDNPELTKHTYLYLHTSHPDVGWDLPAFIKEFGVGNKVLFTYVCRNAQCKFVFPSFFQDSVQACPKCRMASAGLPSIDVGVTPEQLSAIMNWFDLYVQYASVEGFGMPMIEAAACGTPVMAINYSAPESILPKLGLSNFLIPVQRMWYALEGIRAYPDNDAFVEMMKNFLNKPKGVKAELNKKVCRQVREHYDWDETAAKWESYLDTIEPTEVWDTTPPHLVQPMLKFPEGLTHEQFVRWCILNIWGQPNRINSYRALRMVRDLNYGKTIGTSIDEAWQTDTSIFSRPTMKDYNRKAVIDELIKLNGIFNNWEKRRVGLVIESPPPFILNARSK